MRRGAPHAAQRSRSRPNSLVDATTDRPDLRRGWAYSPLGFVRRVYSEVHEDNVFFLASALAFNGLIAALPFTLIVLAVLGYLAYSPDDPVGSVASVLDAVLPQDPPVEMRRAAEDFLTAIGRRRDTLSALGIPLFLWLSTRFYSSARVALNEVFDTDESRTWAFGKSVDLVLVLTTLVLLLCNTAVTIIVPESRWFARFLNRLAAFSIGLVLFFVVYTVAPSRRVRWDTALVAASVAALAFEVAKILFGIYIKEFASFDRLLSGSNFLAIVLLILWVYYMAVAFLIGGEVAETYDLMRRQREQRAILT